MHIYIYISINFTAKVLDMEMKILKLEYILENIFCPPPMKEWFREYILPPPINERMVLKRVTKGHKPKQIVINFIVEIKRKIYI